MKYLKLLLLFILLINTALYSQKDDKKILLEASLGVNNSWIINQNTYGTMRMPYGTAFGLSPSFGINFHINKIGFNFVPSYSKLGQYYSGEHYNGKASRRISLQYIELPLLFSYKIFEDKKSMWLSLGPDILILAKAKQKYKNIGGVPLPKPELFLNEEITDRYNKVDIGAMLKFSHLTPLGYYEKWFFYYSLKLFYGFSDINEENYRIKDYKGEYFPSKNFYFGGSLGIMFNLKSK